VKATLGTRPRDSLLIIRDILFTAAKEASKTEIVYRSNINFLTADKYLSRLLLRGLVETVKSKEGRTRFRTTQLGAEVLQRLSEIQRIVGEVDPVAT
jgi:predicted transcriptional regulator